MYVENNELPPQSMIREDDIEVYIRGVSYRNKVSSLMDFSRRNPELQSRILDERTRTIFGHF